MLKNGKAQTILFAIVLLSAFVLVAQDRQPVFYFGGKSIFVGMAKSDAVAALSACCKLSPSATSEDQQRAATDFGRIPGQFILSKEEQPQRILGAIYFGGGKVTSVTRPLGEGEYAPWNDDVVGLTRALYRALSPTTGDSETTATVSVWHERLSNGETEVLSIAFPNGRGVRLNMIKLDKPLPGSPSDSRDQVTLEEFLQPRKLR